ncbi:MAG: phosphotransferase family protein [Bacillota bacterium]
MLPSEVNWDNWSSFFTNLDMWRRPVEQVLALLGLSPVYIHPGFPGTSAAFAVDCAPLEATYPVSGVSRVVVKFYPPMVHRDFQAEVSVRTALQERATVVPYPRILLSGILSDRINWPYIIEEFRPGRATREVWVDLTRDERDILSRRLAAVLADLHSTPLSLLPSMSGDIDSWRHQTCQRLDTCMERLTRGPAGQERRLPETLLADLRDFVEKNGKRLVDSVEASSLRLIHNDLTEDHLLIEKGQEEGDPWRISALLDYGDAKIGPIEEEWVVLSAGMFEMDPIAMRVFLGEYRDLTGAAADSVCPDNPIFRERMLLLTLTHQFCGEIVREAMIRARVDPSTVTDARTLMDVLWPILA